MGPFVYKTCFAQMCDLKEENKPDELCSHPGIAPPDLKAAQKSHLWSLPSSMIKLLEEGVDLFVSLF